MATNGGDSGDSGGGGGDPLMDFATDLAMMRDRCRDVTKIVMILDVCNNIIEM